MLGRMSLVNLVMGRDCMNTTLMLLLVGQLITTSYRSVPSQTDNSPFITSTGERVHKHGVAVSEDLLCPRSFGKTKRHARVSCAYKFSHLHYGDWIYVEKYGLKEVNDVMNARHSRRIDLWVATYKEEKAVGTRRLNVYLVSGEDK